LADRRKRPTPAREPIKIHGVSTWNAGEDYADAPVCGEGDAPPEPSYRIDYILHLFRSLRWMPVLTPRALGRLWNLEPTTVERDATQAHTFTKLGPVQREEHQATSRMALENIARIALAAEDFGAAIKAIETAGKFAGLRLDSPIDVPSESVKALPHDELKRLAKEYLEKDKA
jgi:hypothetical protein